MLVSRKYDDALAALSCGVGVVLIASGVKPVPNSIAYLGLFSYAWGVLILLAALAAAGGALLRVRGESEAAIRRRFWSITLERIAWPVLGVATASYAVGVVDQFGFVDAALTIGFAAFVIFTCSGHWRVIRSQGQGVGR